MRDIAALLFGTDLAEPREAREAHGPRQAHGPREACVPGDARGWDDPPAPAGDWCQTSPGQGTLDWLGLTRRRDRRTRRG
jgi:hypothetical protein